MIFNNDAAGVGVAHVEDQVDRNGRGAERMGDKFHFRHGQLLAEHRQEIEPVRLIFKAAHCLVQLALRAFFNAVRKLGKGFAQPAVNPGLIEEVFHFLIAPGEGETGAVQNVVFDRRQRGSGVFCNLAVEREGHAMRIACRIRGIQFAHLHASPVVRAINEGAWRIKAQER